MDNAVKTKKNYKGSIIKRLIRESLILSCLNKLSDRVLKLFSGGIFYLVFCGCDEADNRLKSGVLGHITSKFNFSSFKRFIASGIEKSYIVKEYRRLIAFLLSASLRSYGIYFCTFGVYSVGIYLAKLYSYITATPGENELIISILFITAGIPMLFSGRSICNVLKTSRIFRWLFIDILGVNELALHERKKPETYGTAAFVFGTFTGLFTAFLSPAMIAAVILYLIILACVLYAPELGLLLSVFLFPIVSVKILAVLLAETAVCYLIKVLRAKRNLSFKTADVFVGFFALYIVAIGLLSGSGGQVRAWYLLCFLSAYFLISNLIVSEKLVRQALYSLCTGAGVSCILYILNYIANGSGSNKYLSNILYNSLAGRSSFGYLLIILLPVAAALTRVNEKRKEKGALLVLSMLTAVCVIISTDKLMITAAYVALSLYILFSNKKIITSLFGLAAFTLIVYFTVPYIPFLNNIFTSGNSAGTHGGINELITAFFPTGVGIGDRIMLTSLDRLGAGIDTSSIGIFGRIIAEGGIFTLLVFITAVYFILQRAFYSFIKLDNPHINSISASFASAMIMFITLGLFYDVWEDIRIYMLFWIICGMISAVRNVYSRAVYRKENVNE